jgi:hypothetical protein
MMPVRASVVSLHQKDSRPASFPDLRDGMPDGETKRIVFFTLAPVREIDLVGAVDVFTSANRAVGGKPLYDIKVVNAEKARADRKIAFLSGLWKFRSGTRDRESRFVGLSSRRNRTFFRPRNLHAEVYVHRYS